MSLDDKSSLKRVGDEPVTSVLSPNEIPVLEGNHDADDEVLAALGYKYVSASRPFLPQD